MTMELSVRSGMGGRLQPGPRGLGAVPKAVDRPVDADPAGILRVVSSRPEEPVVSQQVRDKVVAPLVASTTEGNLAQTVLVNAHEVPDKVVFATRAGSGWQDVTAAEFADQVAQLAKGLIAAGVGVGDRVALMSRTRYEWTLVDYAIWTAGAVTVPIYETSSPDQVGWILEDSGAMAVVVETATHAGAVAAVRDQVHQPAATSGRSSPAPSTSWSAPAPTSATRPSQPAGTAPTAPRWRRSSTPRARPVGPRAAS